MAQLLDQAEEGDLVGYKQSFAGACWQMPELAAAGGDLAVPFEKMCRDELYRGMFPMRTEAIGDATVSSILDTLLGTHLRVLSRRSARRVDCRLLEPVAGERTQKALTELKREMEDTFWKRKQLTGATGIIDAVQQMIARTDAAPEGHRPIRTASHGDLHGGNVMVDSRGNPWLIDCGMSKDVPEGYPLMDAAKLFSCILFAYCAAPLTVDDVQQAPVEHLADWMGVKVAAADSLPLSPSPSPSPPPPPPPLPPIHI